MRTTGRRSCKAILVGSLALAFAATGIAGIGTLSASAEEPSAGGKIFYYVDAGNLVDNPNGTGNNVNRDKYGYPSVVKNQFMKDYALDFGTGADGVYTAGLYNSVTDNQFGADGVTGKNWGFSASVEGYSWDYWRIGTTASSDSHFYTYRQINETAGEGVLTYKFEVDDDTTPLKVEFGTRTASGWSEKPYKMKINGGDEFEIVAKETDEKHSYDTVTKTPAEGDAVTSEIKGIKDEADDKNYITLDFSTDGRNAFVNYIMVTTADYVLPDPVSYAFPSFVEKGSTEIEGSVTAGGETRKVIATLDDANRKKINDAALFDTVSVTIAYKDLDNADVTDTIQVSVLPRETKYFVNFGDVSKGTPMLSDAEYTQNAGYGDISETRGTAGWVGDNYYTSSRYGGNGDVFQYRFDKLEEGNYGVILGTTRYNWGDRAMLVSINGGAKKEFAVPESDWGTKHEVFYGAVDANDEGSLILQVEKQVQDYVVTFAVVYQVNKITYDSNGGTAVDPVYFDLGTSVELPVKNPTRTAYEFDGWYTEKTGGTKIESTATLSATQTLYAHWSAKTYSVVFVHENGEESSPVSITAGTKITAEMLPEASAERTGYTYGWYTSENVSDRVKVEVGTVWEFDTEELYGMYVANEYQVTLNAGAGTLTDAEITAVYDEEVLLPDPTPAEGYVFDGWFTAETDGTRVESGTWKIENTTLYARYSRATYGVTFNVNGGSAVAAVTVNHGEKVAKPADPTRMGYTFGGWYSDEACTQAFDFETAVTAEITLYAKWTENAPEVITHEVIFYANGGSEVAKITVNDGGKIIKPADPTREGYKFTGWYSDEACTQAFNFETAVNADTALYAGWEEVSSNNNAWVIAVCVVAGCLLIAGVTLFVLYKKGVLKKRSKD